MPAPDRDKLLAGLSGLLAGTPSDDAAAAPAAEAPKAEATPAPKPAKRKPKPSVKPKRTASRPKATPAPATGEEGEHVRTTTGYVRADGDRVHRVSVMLTKAERRRLRDLAEDEGLTITDLVRRELGL